jgi:uncharacterized membrane protein YjjB (DUF3815 family)
MNLSQLLHHSVCGGLGAAGFAVLFNVRFRALPSCAAMGALGIALRTLVLGYGWTMEAATFIAALALAVAVQLLPVPNGVSRNAMNVVGVIPMIPGGLVAKAILGLFAITATSPAAIGEIVPTALAYALHVAFVIFALGTGLAIPTVLLKLRAKPRLFE